MSGYALTTAWQKIALAGSLVIVENGGSSPAYIQAGANPPDPADVGLILRQGDVTRSTYNLTQDLYARAVSSAFAAPFVAVLDGITSAA